MDQKFCTFHGTSCLIFSWALLLTPTAFADFTIRDAVQNAIDHDPWLDRSRASESALRYEAKAAGQLPDPKLTLAIANLPTDSFSFSQEPMTQVQVGITQAFPAGKSLSLRQERLQQLGHSEKLEQLARKALIEHEVNRLWVDIARAEESITIIESSRRFFEQLLQVTEARYNSATRRTRQQDIIRAQLEVSRLEDRLLQLKEDRDRGINQLGRWVEFGLLTSDHKFPLPMINARQIADSVLGHPDILALDQQVEAARTELELSRQSTKPGWSVNSSYGHRDEDFNGRALPDFFSVGVTVQLPFFRKNRQNKEIAAAAERVVEREADRFLRVRELDAQHQEARTTIERLTEQIQLYEQSLLPQSAALSRATLAAYQSDEGDFTDVTRAYITELDTRVQAVGLQAERQRKITTLNYLNATAAVSPEK